MSKTKNTKKKSSSKKPSEKTSAKQALANVEVNIARIEAAENGTLAPEATAVADAVPVAPRNKPARKPKADKPAKQPKPKKEKPAKARRPSLLDHAVAVLRKHGKPMSTKEITDEVLKAGEWKTSGKTPSATLYSAIIREIAVKKSDSRFRKAERGKFELKG